MNGRCPRIRLYSKTGQLLVREGLSFNFYMRRPHQEVAPAVKRSLDAYLRAIGPKSLGWYADEDGYWQELDDAGWALTWRQLLDASRFACHLGDADNGSKRYRFEYYGKSLENPQQRPGDVCAVGFWLPTEFLEEQGPERVRELALELAQPLPFCSGHAGLSFNGELDLLGVMREVRQHAFRHPGIDVVDLSRVSWQLGNRVRGAFWLNFLGPPVLGELGETAGLRKLLSSPEAFIQELEGGRTVVTLGQWPEAGDIERGHTLPMYREFARVLEPWLYHQLSLRSLDSSAEETHRWERRFLDSP
jgi:Protein of unknown function (DUF3396)